MTTERTPAADLPGSFAAVSRMNALQPITTPVSRLSAETMAECAAAKARMANEAKLRGESAPQILREAHEASYSPTGQATRAHLAGQYERKTYTGD
jgi:hypothetical protein